MLQLTTGRSAEVLIGPAMISPVAERIRGEFREMPGLTLTAAQARRLWSLDENTCNEALEYLVTTGFLCKKEGGAFCRTTDFSARPMRMAKAAIPPIDGTRTRRVQI